MTSDRDLGQSSFQSLVELERLRSDRNSEKRPVKRSATFAIEKSASRNWFFEATQRREDHDQSLKDDFGAKDNNRLAQYFEITPELTRESKLILLQDELNRIDELTIDRLRTLRRDIAKLLHPDRLENSETGDATLKLAEINAALDTAISQTLANSE